jgi:2',3'-cyclic-nucleotide 2'-phosphodiesterase (5'-nucleotidase family)
MSGMKKYLFFHHKNRYLSCYPYSAMTIRFLKIAAVFLLYSCNTSYHPGSLHYTDYPVDAKAVSDTSFGKYLKPFRDSMDMVMNEIVGNVEQKMDVKRPVTTLGNFLSDAYLFMAREKFDQKADIAVMNLGGIRRPYIEAGPLTRGEVFEVMPFDNLMVIITVKGELLKKFLDDLAAEGAGVAGMTMTMVNKKADKIMIAGKDLDMQAMYTMVTSDYAANNPSMSWFYGNIKRTDTKYLLRDAIIDYAQSMQKSGGQIGINLENRLTIGN